jgi:hypothetical protein
MKAAGEQSSGLRAETGFRYHGHHQRRRDMALDNGKKPYTAASGMLELRNAIKAN